MKQFIYLYISLQIFQCIVNTWNKILEKFLFYPIYEVIDDSDIYAKKLVYLLLKTTGEYLILISPVLYFSENNVTQKIMILKFNNE